jgi:homoaconitase/3-isopropylmalate dehydratase large subunit
MSVDGRATLCNMSVEAGAKVGMVEPDEKVESYVGKRTSELRFVRSDPDAFYDVELDLDVSDLDPQVACPPSVSDVKPVSEVEGVPADQFFIGSCTNGRLEDLRVAARVLRGKKVKEGVRLIIIPASKRVYADSLKEGLIEEFLRAGAVVCNPCCGPCIGLSLGLLAADEVCISSANRNFVSRMGHPKSRIYLASPATVAASAVIGELTDPRELRT